MCDVRDWSRIGMNEVRLVQIVEKNLSFFATFGQEFVTTKKREQQVAKRQPGDTKKWSVRKVVFHLLRKMVEGHLVRLTKIKLSGAQVIRDF